MKLDRNSGRKALRHDPNYFEAHCNLAVFLTNDYYKDFEGAKLHLIVIPVDNRFNNVFNR